MIQIHVYKYMLSNIGKWIKKHNTTTQRNSIHRGNGMKSRKMQTKKLEIFFGISRFCPSEKTKITSSGHTTGYCMLLLATLKICVISPMGKNI